MNAARPVIVLSMPDQGHVNRLLPVIEGLSARDVPVVVLTHVRFSEAVERHGGRLLDLFHRFPIERADTSSLPIPSRYVTFAAVYFDALLEWVAALDPALIVYDTFAVVAPMLGRRLGIPYVNCCSGHASVPSRMIAAVRADPRIFTSEACHAAVRVLREEHGMEKASPFSFFDNLSPHLNLYPEPPEFLSAEDRAVFEPVCFVGSLSPQMRDAASNGSPTLFDPPSGRLRVYVSFGTVMWRYFAAAATPALETLAAALSRIGADTCISLGDRAPDPRRIDQMSRPGVRAHGYVDQWRVLRDADVFFTHHGLNSTHESIYHGVPMISYPFFGDQLGLTARCQELGVAVPLAPSPRARFAEEDVVEAIEAVRTRRSALEENLARVRGWELRTNAGRPAVIDRILALL